MLERSGGHRGAARLRSALDLYQDTPFTRSGLERSFLDLVEKAGLPQPSMNLHLAGYEIDAYFPAERFAVELDAYSTHGGPAAFERDRLRQEDLKLAGIEMTRVTARRLARDPQQVGRRMAAVLAQRRRELGMPDRGR
jgi:hypothetical protein